MPCSNQLSYVATGREFSALTRRGVNGNAARGGARGSDVEPEVDHVAVLDHVLLALQPPLARVLCSLLAVAAHEILVGDHFRADEALLEIGVDHAGRFRRA